MTRPRLSAVACVLTALFVLAAPSAHAQPQPTQPAAPPSTTAVPGTPVVTAPQTSTAQPSTQQISTQQPSTQQPTAGNGTNAPQPGEPESGGSPWLLPALIGFGVLVLAGAGFAITRRRVSVPPAVAGFGDGLSPTPMLGLPEHRRPEDSVVLADALRVVAANAPGEAIRTQVTRLLDQPHDRAALVQAAIRLRDQLTERGPGLADHLLGALGAVGVTPVRADGELFDPHRHTAVGSVDAPRPDLRDRVAETVKPGYLDRGAVLRLPDVVLYR
ncbi:nucleotide exchange factor GrpE [Actinokineospora inagensis]|uniref:nucleotide exchange factor GrpE n=1 Tax=Actinokineospora inagensis TaxID=103730 RepID=UPI000413DACC|nr:nucleotide exchange factor GrpE [Actinokineospora inagensis]